MARKRAGHTSKGTTQKVRRRYEEKGLSLPIEMLVIIAIAVLVLVVLAAFFSGSFISQGEQIKMQSSLQTACSVLRSSAYNCGSDGANIQTSYTKPGAGTNTPLDMEDLCIELKYGNFRDCSIAFCGCPRA